MQFKIFLKNVLHLAYPLAEKLVPGSPRRLVGGILALPVRLVPLLLTCAAYLGLVYLGEFIVGELLYRFVVLLKLPKVFRIEWLEPSFFGMLGYQFRRAGLAVLALYAAYRALGTAGSAVYLTDREIVVLKRWPFSVSLIRIPLTSIRYAGFVQFPGERLLTTGRIVLSWSDRETLTLPGVPRGEAKLELIMERLNGQSRRGQGRQNGRQVDDRHEAALGGRPRSQRPERTGPQPADNNSDNNPDNNHAGRRRRRRRGRRRGSEQGG